MPSTPNKFTLLLFSLALAASTLVFAAAPQQAHAYDIFLNLGTGIPMASAKRGYETYGSVLTFSFATSRSVSFAGPSPEISQPQLTEVSVSRLQDAASAKLWESAVGGKIIPTVKFALFDSKNQRIVEIELTNVLVTNYNVSASAGADPAPYESFGLTFAKMKYTTRSFDPSGKALANVTTWNVTTASP